MNLPDFLEMKDGEIRLTGHRIGLYHVICCYNEGYSVEKIAAHFPTLSLSHIHKVIAFYLDHQDEVDAYVTAYRAQLDKQEADIRSRSSTPTLKELRERLARMQRAEQARVD